jgi:hypothetical protein
VTTTMIKTTGLSITAAPCLSMPAVLLPVPGLVGLVGFGGLGVSDVSIAGTGLMAIRDERPMSASVAAEAAANQGYVYAAGAGNHRSARKQNEQQHTMWAFRGPGPWKQPT